MTSFLQTPAWAAFAAQAGDQPVWIEYNGTQILALKRQVRRFGYCLSVSRLSVPVTEELIALLKEQARHNGCFFVRIEPTEGDVPGGTRVHDFMPSKTVILDLTRTEEELLAAMHPKTRYNIRLAEKKGVTCERIGAKGVAEITRLIGATYGRKGKSALPRDYYEKLGSVPGVDVWVGRFAGSVIVANMCIGSDATYTYLHGGSDDVQKSVMAPHLLQWEQIKYAKAQGFTRYDFWGIDERRYPGVTRFKMGFGGDVVCYPGTFEVGVEPLRYMVYRILKKLLRK